MMMLAGLSLLSGLLPLAGVRSVTVSRVLPEEEISAGDPLMIRVTLMRRWRVPMVWFALEDQLHNDCGLEERRISLRAVFAPMFAREMTVHFDVNGLDRGVYAMPSVIVTCGDLFGLTCVRRELPLHSELVVAPAWTYEGLLGEASASRSVPSVPAAGGHVRNNQVLREPGVDGVPMNRSGSGPDTRAYRDGDSIRHLDFRSAARGRGLHTKVYAGEAYKEWHVAIDQYAVPYNGDEGLFDACISLSLGTVMRASDEGHIASLHTGEWTFELSGSTGREQDAGVQELRRRLAYLRPSAELADQINLDGVVAAPFQDKMLRMFSADWQDAERWSRLFDHMGTQGIRLELYLLTRNAVLTFAMREQARQLEERGIAVTWMQVAQSKEARTAAGEGVKVYAMG